MRSGLKVLAFVIVVGIAAYALLRPRSREPHPPTEGDMPARAEARVRAPTPAGSSSPTRVAASPRLPPAPATAPAETIAPAAGSGDVVAIETLRDLLNRQPLRVIELARQANKRAPDAPEAPERAWMIAKALAGLGRFHEARDAAADLASKYPDTSWAMDAKRHLLVQPLDLPSREVQQQEQQQEQQYGDQGR